MSKKGSTRRHRRAREQVLSYATHCHLCGQPARPGDPLVADHLIPRAHGGPDSLGNYAAAHASCNSARGTRPLANTPVPHAIPRPPTRHPKPTRIFTSAFDDSGVIRWYSRDW